MSLRRDLWHLSGCWYERVASSSSPSNSASSSGAALASTSAAPSSSPPPMRFWNLAMRKETAGAFCLGAGGGAGIREPAECGAACAPALVAAAGHGGVGAPAFRAKPGLGAGAGACMGEGARGKGRSRCTPYFSQMRSYISSSQPEYFSSKEGTSATFAGLCCS